MFTSQLSQLKRDESGNVAIIFALAAPVLMFGVGFAVDYGLYARDRVRLEMLADEASLSMVSQQGMEMTPTQAKTVATNLFCSQAIQVPQLSISTPSPDLAQCQKDLTLVVNTNPTTGVRNVSVSFEVAYLPIFAALLNDNRLALGGTSAAQSATASAADADFTLLLDNQVSMALPATADGIAKMQSLTKAQLPAANGNPAGCAFACHEAAPNKPVPPFGPDTQGNPCVPGAAGPNCPQIDNYTLARNNGITLRFDAVTQAANALIEDAAATQAASSPAPTYKFAVYSVDAPYVQGLYNVMPLTANFARDWAANAARLQLYTVYSIGGACVAKGADPCGAGASTGGDFTRNVGFFSSPMGDEMQTLASVIPQAGDGKPGDAPKQTLIVVTDGVEDTIIDGALHVGLWDDRALAACSALKQNGVQIAILYTTYFPTPGWWLYDDYVSGVQSRIGPTLRGCATPGLFMTAGVDDNLTTDLLKLFNVANQSARLTQ